MRRKLLFALMVAGTMACQSVTNSTDPTPSTLLLNPHATPYEAIDLGILPGMLGAQATDINGRGQVVGWNENGVGGARAFLWQDGVLRDLGSLGGGWSYAQDINENGQIVGVSATADGRFHTFLWSDGVMTDLEPDAAVQESFLTPYAHINNAGHVAFTGIVDWGPRWQRRAYLWRDGVTTDLGTLGGTLTSSQITAINEHDQVVGLSTDPTFSGGHAFSWNQGTLRDLGTLGGSGTARAVDINDDGQVVGISNNHAVLWENGGITDLGTLPGDYLGTAVAINEAGQVAGTSLFDPYKAGHAFRWQAGVLVPLSASYLTDSLQLVSAMNENGLAAGDWRPQSGPGSQAVAWENGVTWVLGAPDAWSFARAVNDKGDVVGYASSSPHGVSNNTAMLWRRTPGLMVARRPKKRL